MKAKSGGIKMSRNKKTYSGVLMLKGKENEVIILRYLQKRYAEVLDFRGYTSYQDGDVDFGLVNKEGKKVLLEIKSDKWISERDNLCFEDHRINHYVLGGWFYKGWGWRSKADWLIIRNPLSGDTFIFNAMKLRTEVGKYIGRIGKDLRQTIVETDERKTTFNYLIPMKELKGIYQLINIKNEVKELDKTSINSEQDHNINQIPKSQQGAYKKERRNNEHKSQRWLDKECEGKEKQLLNQNHGVSTQGVF